MTVWRRRAKRDANEALIFEAFRAAGCAVLPTSIEGGPDAVVVHGTRFFLVEVKARLGKLTPAQILFHQAWTGPEIYIIRTVSDAMALVAKG